MTRTIITTIMTTANANNNAKNVDRRDSSVISVQKISQINSHSFNYEF